MTMTFDLSPTKVKGNPHTITSHVSGRGHSISPVHLSVCLHLLKGPYEPYEDTRCTMEVPCAPPIADVSTVPISVGLSRFWPYCPAVPPKGTMSRQRTVSAALQFFNSNRTVIKGFLPFFQMLMRWSLSTLHCDSVDLLV